MAEQRRTTYRPVQELINFLAQPTSKNNHITRSERIELSDALRDLKAEVDRLSREKAEIKQEACEMAEKLNQARQELEKTKQPKVTP